MIRRALSALLGAALLLATPDFASAQGDVLVGYSRAGGAAPVCSAGPLDIQGGALAAFSLRNLSLAWCGQPVVTIMRSDFAETTQSFSTSAVGAPPQSAVNTFISALGTFTQTGALNSGNPNVVMASATGIQVNQTVSCADCVAGTIVSSIGGSPTIQLTPAPTGTNPSEVLTFGNQGFASKWNDQSGNANDVIGKTGFGFPADQNQPQWVSADVNGGPSLSFWGGTSTVPPGCITFNCFLETAGNVTYATTGYTIFAVVKPFPGASGGPVAGFFDNTTNSYLEPQLYQAGSNTYNLIGDAFDGTGSTAEIGGETVATGTLTGYHLYECAWDASSFECRIDGVVVTQSSSFTYGTMTSQSDPLDISTNASDFQFTGSEAEVIIYNSNLSSGTRGSIRSNIMGHYAIP